jgi:hypothetical protein
MQRIPAALAAATVLDRAAKVHRVGAFWAADPVLLVFLRHFA